MPRQQSVIIAVAMLIGVALVTFLRLPVRHPLPPNEIVTAIEITDTEGLERFLSSKKAVLHIDVGWAVQADLSRPIVLQLREWIEHDKRFEDVIFRRIDMTEQEACPLWNLMMKWLNTNGEGHDPLISGFGAIVWIEDGKLSKWVMYPKEAGIEKLWSITIDTF